MPVNEATRQHLARHVTEYKAAAPAAREQECSEIEARRAYIDDRKRATVLDVIRMELDGMTGDEIALAFSAAERMTTGHALPLCKMEVVVDGVAIVVLVWPE